MDAIRLHSDGTLSSEAPFAGLLRMRLELDGDVTLRSFFRLLKAAAAGIGDVGGEPTGGDAAAMVERQFRLLLFRQPKSQFRGVVAAGRSRTRKQDVLEQHLATP